MNGTPTVYTITAEQVHEIRNSLEIILLTGTMVEKTCVDDLAKKRMAMLIIAAERVGNILNSVPFQPHLPSAS